MSRGLGQLQRSIMAAVEGRQPDVLTDVTSGRVFLAEGVIDMRAVAAEMTRIGQFSDRTLQAAFSRAVAGLIERGLLEAVTMVKVDGADDDTRWKRHLHQLADGIYLVVPPGRCWRRRFVRKRYAGLNNA